MKVQNKINCIVVDDEPLAREVIVSHTSKIDVLEHIGSFSNALAAFDFITQNQVDLIFLDIQMPELTGIDFLKELNPSPKVIFTTAYSNYAVDAFNLDAVDYLVKPIRFSRFLKSVNKVFQQVNLSYESSLDLDKVSDYEEVFIYLKVEKKMQKIYLKDILYVESLKNYIKVKTINREIVAHKSISAIRDILPIKKFLRVHRSFIVNIDAIDAFSPSEIEIKKNLIPVGRNYKEEVKEVLGYF